MKTIVFTLPDGSGGVVSVVRNLLENYQGNCRTKVILFRNKKCKNVSPSFNCDDLIVLEYDEREPIYKIYRTFIEHIDENCILVSNDGNIELGAMYYNHINIPVVYILHGISKYYFGILSRFNAIIDSVICVSSYLRDSVEKSYPDSHVSFLPVPVPHVPINRRVFKEDCYNVTYLGGLYKDKGIELFPDFVDLLGKEIIPFRFNILGDGPYMDFLKGTLNGLDRIDIYGNVEKSIVEKVLLKSDVLILFSKSEGLPVCVVEAMKAGVVPVVFDLPTGIRDVIDDGENGFIVPQGDICGAVARIKELHENPSLRKRMADNAVMKANAMFDPVRQAKAYFDEITGVRAGEKIYSYTLKERILTHVSPRIYFPIYNFIHKKK